MGLFMFWDRHWKLLMWLPVILLIVSVGILAGNVLSTGEIMKKDVDLTGGKLITIEFSGDASAVKVPGSMRVVTGARNLLLIETAYEVNENGVIEAVGKAVNIIGEPTITSIGPELSSVFWQQAQLALVMAFVLMAITVFILFRTFVPSMAVIFAAATDIIVTVAVLSLIGAELSLSMFAALLMLIGYSVDTDVLLTNRLLKRNMEMLPAIKSAMKTGLTMTFTTIAAVTALYMIAEHVVIEQIATVLLIGLVVDMFSTWLTNTGILRWYLEKKSKV